MSNPAAPQPPDEPGTGRRSNPAGLGPDPDDPNPFGPDAPNVREDDPPGGQFTPEAPPPTPPAIPLDDDAFAPDES